MVDLLAQAKGMEKVVLITDAISAAGMPDGRYRLGSLQVELQAGKCLVDGRLAGSALTMDRAVRNFREFAKADLQLAVTAATANPARVVRENGKGTLDIGKDADFVVMTGDGEIRAAVIQGVVVGKG
jgi:N-acetylglucosamine-6-phosphate deacetylase